MDRIQRIGAALAVSGMTLCACGATSPGPPDSGALRDPADGQDPPPTEPPDGTAAVLVGPGEIPLFEPSTLTINVGDTVHWDFVSEGHNVVSGENGVADGKFCAPSNLGCTTAPAQPSGTAYEFQFSRAGTYPYFCSLHVAEGMLGVITVTP